MYMKKNRYLMTQVCLRFVIRGKREADVIIKFSLSKCYCNHIELWEMEFYLKQKLVIFKNNVFFLSLKLS